MLASRGETGESCGVPASLSDTTPPSNTPARSQLQHPPVDNPAFDLRHEGVVVDVVEACIDVGVEHPLPTPLAA